MKIISVNVGTRKKVNWRNKIITTGIFKHPVTHINLGEENVLGDDVIDRKCHGGIEKAVYAYSLDHYEFWQQLYPQLEFNYGMFGENLTISHLYEERIRVGEIFKVGTAKVEATKPREPCYKLGIRFNDSKIIKQFWNSSMCGVYFKIVQAGEVKADDIFIRTVHKPDKPTIAEVYSALKKR